MVDEKFSEYDDYVKEWEEQKDADMAFWTMHAFYKFAHLNQDTFVTDGFWVSKLTLTPYYRCNNYMDSKVCFVLMLELDVRGIHT